MSEKAAFCLYKMCYFIFASAWGYMIMLDQPYFPKVMGGNGVFDKGWDGYPYQKQDPRLKNYLLITMGYHVGGFFTHFLSSRRQSDFIEMGLHHIVAFYLYMGTYMYNSWEIGSTIALLHDLADILVNLSKVMV